MSDEVMPWVERDWYSDQPSISGPLVMDGTKLRRIETAIAWVGYSIVYTGLLALLLVLLWA